MLQNILTGDCNGRFAMISKISPDFFERITMIHIVLNLYVSSLILE